MELDFKSEVFSRLGEIVKTGGLYEKRTGNNETYKNFIEQFPAEEIRNLTLDQYCMGKNSIQGNFCWWLERGLEKTLGRYSPGNARGHVLYKDKSGGIFTHRTLTHLGPEGALQYTMKLHSVIANADARSDYSWLDNADEIFSKANVEPLHIMGAGRKLRILAVYHPDDVIPISSSNHLGIFLEALGYPKNDIPKENQPFARMRLLTQYYEQAKQQFNAELTPFGFMEALYSEELGINPGNDAVKPRKDNDDDDVEEIVAVNRMPLNQILYGPPGTGKTYSTTNLAVKIADPEWYQEQSDEQDGIPSHSALKQRYDELVADNRIVFTTFHQSFSYEDFIEGIRASTEKDDNNIRYKVESGVFKRICTEADRSIKSGGAIGLATAPTIWKISIGRRHEVEMRQRYFNNGEARIGWNSTGDLTVDYEDRTDDEQAYWDQQKSKNRSTIRNFSERMKVGDVLLCLKDAETVQAIGIVTSDYWFDDAANRDDEVEYAHVRNVNWILRDINFHILPINGNRRLVQQTVYELDRISWDDLKVELKKQDYSLPTDDSIEPATLIDWPPTDRPHDTEKKPNYVFIIDEINRGNISRIFGELITLLEPGKRKGAEDARKVVLPYSKETFSVPENVYVIGTMNTADKSLAQLDLALRRRFSFKEMPPEPQLLEGVKVHGVDIGEMLSVINQRIEVLLDRDHLIGHSYFFPLLKMTSAKEREAGLTRIFEKQIIPLLQEYFFDDWERISWVLNDPAKPKTQRFILDGGERSLDKLFHTSIREQISERRFYVNGEALSQPDAYRGILVSTRNPIEAGATHEEATVDAES
ncbi:AAA domain (dynein-related subfamily) [Microbulbifer donghaiensis]|uniref:AAA domain (Dynein-related subfamily) n=1 Tax=Microbulbifer donghaiensis TaxID=494016 RepID=A0A1M5IIS1_9GAMM|nr:AAA family ATPase [Microbulbifer donghaiensis]SHG28136.1 AAA domain (dynein-related subfamily) [Microbulbifer donghaiensis]